MAESESGPNFTRKFYFQSFLITFLITVYNCSGLKGSLRSLVIKKICFKVYAARLAISFNPKLNKNSSNQRHAYESFT